MKTATLSSRAVLRTATPYPNAANRRVILGKLLDYLVIAASSIGICAALIFVLTLG